MVSQFNNRVAAFLWALAAIWLGMLFTMTYQIMRIGPVDGQSTQTTWLVLAFFWLGGVALSVFVVRESCISVTVDHGHCVTAVWRYPTKVVRKTFPAEHFSLALLVEDKDTEGLPYFYARVITLEGDIINILEGHNRERCADTCVRFNDALRPTGSAA